MSVVVNMCNVSWQSSLCLIICPRVTITICGYLQPHTSVVLLNIANRRCVTANTVFCDLNEFSLADRAGSHGAAKGKNATLIRGLCEE
jgi:hypothetical protein